MLYNIVKDIFLAYTAKKKKVEKTASFLLVNFLFLEPKKAFYRSRIS